MQLAIRLIVQISLFGVSDVETEFPEFASGQEHERNIAKAWPVPVTSDAQGRFTIPGVAANHGLYLVSSASDRFARQDIALNTVRRSSAANATASYRPLYKNGKPGEELVVPLAPAQWFEGRVTFQDTGQPAPHARLTIWASQQEHGSMMSVAGQADAEGRYRICPMPGIRFGINVYPPDGIPYLARQTDSIKWEAGDTTRHVDLALPRGVQVRGAVVEAGTKTPVAGASIQYVPERVNNRNVTDDILTGWQGIQLSDAAGKFAIAVCAGPRTAASARAAR